MLKPIYIHTNRSLFKQTEIKPYNDVSVYKEATQPSTIFDANVKFSSSKQSISICGKIESLYLRVRPHKNAKYFVEISLGNDLSKQYGMKSGKLYRFKIQYPIFKNLQDNKPHNSIPIILVKRNPLFKPVLEPYKLKIDTKKLLG